jgi:hypothetical protein
MFAIAGAAGAVSHIRPWWMINIEIITVAALAALIVCIVAAARMTERIIVRRELEAMMTEGRAVDAATALGKLDGGECILVENATQLPGRWWLVPVDTGLDVDTCILRDAGFVIYPIDKPANVLFQSRVGVIRVDGGVFED